MSFTLFTCAHGGSEKMDGLHVENQFTGSNQPRVTAEKVPINFEKACSFYHKNLPINQLHQLASPPRLVTGSEAIEEVLHGHPALHGDQVCHQRVVLDHLYGLRGQHAPDDPWNLPSGKR